MKHPVLNLASLDPCSQAELKGLTTAPAVAWPTVLLWLALTLAILSSYALCLGGVLPLWVGALINSVVGYMAFSVGHDAVHRSISTNQRLNDWVGHVAVIIIAPYINLNVFRWAHFKHHRHAGDARDPDGVFAGPWWSLPFRWAFVDVLYAIHLIRYPDQAVMKHLRPALLQAGVSVLVIASCLASGYGAEVLFLWFIPTRVAFLALGFAFFWLPHRPHDTSQAENFTRASTIRLGLEPLMTPLLQFQNFHLIHHLFPRTPFYNNAKVWRLLQPEMYRHDLAIQHGWSINPTIHHANAHRAAEQGVTNE